MLLAVAIEIGLALAFVDEVVLARDVMHVELRFADQLIGDVELVGLGKMRDVAGVNHEGGLDGQSRDLADRLA